jgi:hypothetical protein
LQRPGNEKKKKKESWKANESEEIARNPSQFPAQRTPPPYSIQQL